MKNFILISIVSLFYGYGAMAANHVVKVEFQDLSKLIKEKNKNVKAASSFLESSDAQTGYFIRSVLPTLKVEGGGETFKTGTFSTKNEPFGSIVTSINVFKGGRDVLEEKARKEQVSIASSGYQKTYFNELTEARKLYWNIIYEREVLEFLKEAFQQNDRNLSAAMKRINAGLSTETDRIEFEIYKTQLEQDFSLATIRNKNFQRELSVLLDIPGNTVFELINFIPHEHNGILSKPKPDFTTHREMKELKSSEVFFRQKKLQSYLWWMPSVDAYAGYFLHTSKEREYPNVESRDEYVLGAKATFEIFDGFQSKSLGASYSFRSVGFGEQASQKANQLNAKFEALKEELTIIHNQIHSSETSVEKGKQYLKQTLAEYKRGVKNSPDVLGATQKLLDVKRRYVDLRRNYQLTKTELLSLLEQ